MIETTTHIMPEIKKEVKRDQSYAKVLCDYLDDTEKLIKTAVKMKTPNFLWNQALLLSIDDGFGLTTFLEDLGAVYKAGNISSLSGDGKMYSEVDMLDSKKGYEAWELVKRTLDEISKKNRDGIFGILCLDISKWMSELDTKEIQAYLRYYADKKASVLMVFRIPYTSRSTVDSLVRIISDTMGVHSLIVPPIGLEQMVDYSMRRAVDYGYSFDKNCSLVLEQIIIDDKNTGRFYGYKSLHKILADIFYKKIVYNMKHGKEDKRITAKQLRHFYELQSKEESIDEMFAQLIGVDAIRKQIEDIIKQLAVAKKMNENGKNIERPTIHMMFTGNPGTGKTTVARIVAKMMKEAGILSKGHLFEIKGRDLCGRYIGETTPKTCAYCRDAYGSVLFIDEAYSLNTSDSERDYGREAVAALIAEMENHRDDMCVIFAGYSEEMDNLMKINPGLKDRIPIKIEFENYNRDQLETIFFNMLDGKFKYEDKMREVAHQFFQSLPDTFIAEKEFSNARFARNLYERVWGMATTRYELGQLKQPVITANDFLGVVSRMNFEQYADKTHRPIGF